MQGCFLDTILDNLQANFTVIYDAETPLMTLTILRSLRFSLRHTILVLRQQNYVSATSRMWFPVGNLDDSLARILVVKHYLRAYINFIRDQSRYRKKKLLFR